MAKVLLGRSLWVLPTCTVVCKSYHSISENHFCGCKKGLITLNHWHHFGVDKAFVKKGRVFNYRRKPIPKTRSVFSLFKDYCPLKYESTFDFTKTRWLYTAQSECDQFLSNPFLVSVGWKFQLKPLLEELYWAFDLYSAMKKWPNNNNLCTPLYKRSRQFCWPV